MEEKVMYKRITRNAYGSPQYSDIPNYNANYNDRYSYINQNKNFNDDDSYALYYSDQMSPDKYYNSTNRKDYKMRVKPRFFRNFFDINCNQYESNNNFNNNYDYNRYGTANNPYRINSNLNRMNISQDMPSPLYLKNNNKYSSSIKHYNNSQINNGFTTDEGESYINCNRDSNFYSQNPYQGFSVIQPEEETLNTNESNVEQLIIYPENNYINENEKFFDSTTKEGFLRPKNLETYTINRIEYIPEDRHKFKPVTLGDYILKNPNSKKKLRLNKSCNDLESKVNSNDYIIKVAKNKKLRKNNKNKKTASSCERIYTRREIKETKERVYDTEINTTSNREKKKKIAKLLEYFGRKNKNFRYNSNIRTETNEEKGGIVYFTNTNRHRRKYNINYKINKKNYKYVKYPKWKIAAAACLIQSWWRSLKELYKDYLNKIIIIQKVYRIHYRSRLRKKQLNKEYSTININERRNYYYGGQNRIESTERINGNKYYNKNICKYYRQPRIDSNLNYKYIYNKYNRDVSYIEPYTNYYKKELSYRQDYSFSLHKNRYNLGSLLLKKILENKLIKIFNYTLFKINNVSEKNENTRYNYVKYRCNSYNNNNIRSYKYKYNNNSYSYSKYQKNLTSSSEKKNLANDNTKFGKLLYKTTSDNESDANGGNLKPINIYAKRNKKKNYLHLNIITANNNFSLMYKGNNRDLINTLKCRNRKCFNNDLLSINNIYSFSVNKNSPYITVNQKQRKIYHKKNKQYNNNYIKSNSLSDENNRYEYRSVKDNIINSKENNIEIISGPKKLPNLINKKYKYEKRDIPDIKSSDQNSEENNDFTIKKGTKTTTIILTDKKKIPKHSLLLKKIFLKIWHKKAQAMKKAKREQRKDKNDYKKKNKNKHILLSNLMAYVFDKIKKEIERRKLITCLKNINKMKYPNLRYALKKIKKFSKVRFKVMNEYASIIQNAFRYYLENKKKEELLENKDNKTNINNKK